MNRHQDRKRAAMRAAILAADRALADDSAAFKAWQKASANGAQVAREAEAEFSRVHDLWLSAAKREIRTVEAFVKAIRTPPLPKPQVGDQVEFSALLGGISHGEVLEIGRDKGGLSGSCVLVLDCWGHRRWHYERDVAVVRPEVTP